MFNQTLSPTSIRRRGWLLLLIGLFLIGLMGTITFNLAPGLLFPGETLADGSRFTGTAEQAQFIFGIFALVIMFGVMSATSGLWQIVTGRRNKTLVVVMLVLFVALLIAGWVTRRVLGS